MPMGAPAPLQQAALIDSRSQTPVAIAQRVTTLNRAGHQWMPADMQTTLASSQTSDNQMVSIADSIKNTLKHTWDGFTEAADDNVLHKQPTTALALTRMIGSSLGPLPVAGPDLTTIQANLQKQGFGQGLSADGVWGADWNTAYNAWSHHITSRQLAGDEPGSTSTGSAGHHIWDALLPSNAINAVVGFAKSLPGDVRNLAADTAAGLASIPHDLAQHDLSGLDRAAVASTIAGATLIGAHNRNLGDTSEHVGAAVESLGRAAGPVSQQQYEQERGLARELGDVGTLLAIVPVAGEGSAAAAAARLEIAKGVTSEAATRGPGVIAKTFFGGLDKSVVTDAAKPVESITARRGLLNTNVVRNIPLLGQTGPVVGRLADSDGLYYRARTLLATPYKYPAVRVAGDIGQRTMLTGAGLRLGAEASQAVAGPNTLTSDIQNTDASSFVDRNLGRIVGDPSATPFTHAVNTLGFLLHGPLGDTANSTAVGDAVDATRAATARVFGQYGVEGAWERAVTKATGSKTTIDDLHKAFGSEDLADRFLTMKVAEIAAAHHAQRAAQEVDNLTFGEPGYREAVGQHADEVWGNPDLHQTALRETTADKFELENRLAADALHAGLDPRHYNPDELASIDAAPSLDSYVTNAQRWMDAGGQLTALIRDGQAAALFGGNGRTAIRAAQDSFDYGYGDASPVRLMDTTRRQYVHEVTTLHSRVSRGVDKARVQAGRAVRDAQQAADRAGSDDALIAGTEPAARGLPPLFHGSRKGIEGPLGDRYRGNVSENLFGPGLYTTDHPDVAGSYGKSGQVYSVHHAGKPPRILDLEQPAPSFVRDQVRQVIESDRIDGPRDDYEALASKLAHDTTTGAELLVGLRTYLEDADLTASQADEIFSGITDEMEANGFDGLKHRGGVYVGRNTQHDAHVFFHPERLSLRRVDPPSLSGIEARNRLKAAQIASQRLESAVTSGRLDRVGPALRDGPRATAAEWTQLAKDHARYRDLIKQALGPEESYNLPDLLDRGVDPDMLYSRINGEARVADTAVGSAEWIRAHLDQTSGTLGLGRVGTKSVQQASADITRFEQRAEQASNPDEVATIVGEMADYGFRELGLTARTLGVFDDPTRLAEILRQHAENLASDVFLPPDASPQLRAAVQKINDLGYKPMMGSHIGHIWDGSLPPIEDLKGAVKRGRRVTDALGLGVNAVSSKTKGQDANIRILRRLDEAFQNPKARQIARATAETPLQVLRDKNLLPPTLRLPEKIVYETTRHLGLHPGIKQLAAEGRTLEEAAKEYEQGLARAVMPQLRDIPRKKQYEALTTPGEGIGPNGPWQFTAYDGPTANLIINAIRGGYSERPNYLLGLSGIEDWFRGGMWIGDHLVQRFPTSELIQRAANAPNTLINLRNRLRFTLSPFFDLRRVTKTNYKMGLDHVSPVFDPLSRMVKDGTFKEAHAYLTKLIGDPEVSGFDDADRYLHSQSVWGKYNARHFEAYYAHEKKLQGATDSEIKQGIHRVFEYGSTRGGGRTPLESTVNTIFFPFSFEKTLLRNTGMYLLDHPQQALLLTGAVQAYDDANKNDKISNWTAEHLPILRDLQKLNAFAHGISPGQFGGINAPLANLFMPQHWGQAYSKKNLETFMPIWKDFGQLLSDTREQADIGKNAALNAFDYAITAGRPRSPFDPYRTTLTPWAQREHASVMRNQFISALTPILDYNAHAGTPAGEYTWPSGRGLPPGIEGQPVTRTSISYLVQRWYPAYDPTFSQQYAQKQEALASEAVATLRAKNPQQGQQLGVLVNLANSYSEKMNNNEYTTPQALAINTQFRQLATAAAETQPGFLSFYNSHFSWLFGPLETVEAS